MVAYSGAHAIRGKVDGPPAVRELIAEAWDEYGAQWKAYARGLVRDTDSADAAVQEAIARTISADPDLRTPLDAHRYLQRAIRNTLYKRWRRESRQRPLEVEGADPGPTVLQRVMAAEDDAARARMVANAVARLSKLDDPVRRALELRFFSDPPLTLREIGEREGCALTTIQSRIISGLRQLASHLAEDGAE